MQSSSLLDWEEMEVERKDRAEKEVVVNSLNTENPSKADTKDTASGMLREGRSCGQAGEFPLLHKLCKCNCRLESAVTHR